jgi:hypothetical protein
MTARTTVRKETRERRILVEVDPTSRSSSGAFSRHMTAVILRAEKAFTMPVS